MGRVSRASSGYRRCATVREMKEGPSGSARRSPDAPAALVFFYSIEKEGDSRIVQAQELEAGEAEEISKAA